MRLYPDTLAGRTLALLIAMTLLLIIGSSVLILDERQERFDERNRFHLIERVTTLVNLLSDANHEERQRIIQRVSNQGDLIELGAQPRGTARPAHPLERVIGQMISRNLRNQDYHSVRVKVAMKNRNNPVFNSDRRHESAHVHDLESIDISVRLRDGNWVNIHTENFEGPPPWARKTVQLLLLLLTLLIISGLIISKRMARPMAQLADAASRFGLGRTITPLPETGPREVRNTIRAFNQMQERLEKHISDRSLMLAAVSHDLRTPITTLRLRAEYIDDDETREKTLATLSEMENILSNTLSFARDEAADEKTRSTDIAALLMTLTDEHSDLGGKVQYQGPDRLIYECRPVSLKRALNNIIDNALKYGAQAYVTLTEKNKLIEITIDDNGPGIPEANIEDVFTPFFRLENSRNRATGGAGLGLAVARTVIHAHGGRLILNNRKEGGLRASISLPLS